MKINNNEQITIKNKFENNNNINCFNHFSYYIIFLYAIKIHNNKASNNENDSPIKNYTKKDSNQNIINTLS